MAELAGGLAGSGDQKALICKEYLQKQTNRRPTADASVDGGAEIKTQTRMPTIQAAPCP